MITLIIVRIFQLVICGREILPSRTLSISQKGCKAWLLQGKIDGEDRDGKNQETDSDQNIDQSKMFSSQAVLPTLSRPSTIVQQSACAHFCLRGERSFHYD